VTSVTAVVKKLAQRPLAQEVVGQNQGHHGFDDGHRAWKHAGVVTAARLENRGIAVDVHCLLFAQDGGHGFEGGAHDDVLAVGNAALDAAGAIGPRADAAVV